MTKMAGGGMYFGLLCLILFSLTGVQSTPAIPGPLTIIQVTTYSVLLEFQAANESVDFYKVEYAKSPSISFTNGVRVSASNRESVYRINQNNLIPGGYYQLRIVPLNGPSYYLVRGIPSETIQVQIAIPAMLASPTVIEVSTYYATLEFTPANGSVTSYAVEYALSASFSYTKGRSATAIDGQNKYRITQTGLIPGKTYDIRIVPYVEVRYSDYKGIASSPVSLTIIRPGLTSNLTVVEVSTYYATVEFSHANGPVSSYQAEYTLTSSSQYSSGNTVDVVDGLEKYRIKQYSLIPGRSYYIRVVPQVQISNRDYRGVPSQPVEVLISKPALTSNLTVVEVSTYYATVEFGHANGPVSSYKAEYALTSSTKYSSGNTVDAVDGQEKYRIKQNSLIPGRSYYIRVVPQVQISFRDYRCEPSLPIEVSILKPALTSNLTVIDVSTYYATVEFSHADGPTGSFLLEYALTTVSRYSGGATVDVVNGQLKYRIKQSNLIPGRRYYIRVVPQIEISFREYRGVPSQPIEVSILKPVLHDAPVIRRISPSSVTVQFFASNGSSTHYRVQYKHKGSYDEVDYSLGYIVAADDRSPTEPYTIRQLDLTENIEYVFRVMPMVKIGGYYYDGTPSPTTSIVQRPDGFPTKADSTSETIVPPDGQLSTTTDNGLSPTPTSQINKGQKDDSKDLMTTILMPVILSVVIVVLIAVVIFVCYKWRRTNAGVKADSKGQETRAPPHVEMEGNAAYQKPDAPQQLRLYEELTLQPVNVRPPIAAPGETSQTNTVNEAYGMPSEALGQTVYNYIEVVPPP